MNSGKAPACVPTWKGHIETTKDALIIFDACFTGALAHCFRRPHDRERNQLIVSGNVFVYEEATSGIKRWTDGIPWSPSRILTNFLIYRKLNNPFPPGEKKRATKRGQRPSRPGDPYPSAGAKSAPSDENYRFSPGSPASAGPKLEESVDKDANRGLLGSLVDSYEFKENGLLKKTMTVVINNVQHHLVSYYSLEDAKFNLETPREDPRLKDIPLRDELLNQPKFKFPNFDDAGDGTFEQMDNGAQGAYAYYPQSGYDPTRHLSTASQGHVPHQEPTSQWPYSMGPYTSQSHSSSQASYSIAPAPSTYMTMPPTPTSYSHHNQPTHSGQNHGQQPSHNQIQHPGHHSSPSQSHHQSPHSSHQSHSTYAHSPQYSTPQSQPNSVHHLAFPEQSGQQMTFGHQISHGLPRPTGVFEFLAGGSQESFGPGHDYYTQNPSTTAPVNDSSLMLPQPWHLSFSQHSYKTEPSFPSYRAQS